MNKSAPTGGAFLATKVSTGRKNPRCRTNNTATRFFTYVQVFQPLSHLANGNRDSERVGQKMVFCFTPLSVSLSQSLRDLKQGIALMPSSLSIMYLIIIAGGQLTRWPPARGFFLFALLCRFSRERDQQQGILSSHQSPSQSCGGVIIHHLTRWGELRRQQERHRKNFIEKIMKETRIDTK